MRVGRPSARARHPFEVADVWLPGRLPRRPMVAGPLVYDGLRVELRLDRLEHGLAVRVAALVVAHLAQLRGSQPAGPAQHLVCRQVVVGGDREARSHTRRTPGAIGLPQRRRRRAYGAAARTGCLLASSSHRAARRLADARGAALDLVAAATEQLLEILEHVVGLLAPSLQETRGEALSVGGGHAAALDGLVERLLDALARQEHHLHRADQG